MREKARDKGRIEDIIKYSENVAKCVEGATYEEFIADIKIYYAVMKNVEVVGEAAYMLTKAFKRNHPQTPWDVVAGMRHVLVHDYANIEAKILWGTAINSIPEIKSQAKRYLSETDWEEWENSEDEF
ncbi:MAG: DUF86 domain-containing protein [Bacteroidales bacterium]|nr:DUF86 domain-containing protein [Bacteroidales bacterium]